VGRAGFAPGQDRVRPDAASFKLRNIHRVADIALDDPPAERCDPIVSIWRQSGCALWRRGPCLRHRRGVEVQGSRVVRHPINAHGHAGQDQDHRQRQGKSQLAL